ncbi:MAG: aminotransferase class I/II-fold pyridoxal phosphate-dependent enzyme [Acidimicrobiia bacterium]
MITADQPMAEFDDLDREWLRTRPGIKWARADEGELAAWVADMDFPIPSVVAAALSSVIERGDLGYPDLRHGPRLEPLFLERMTRRHGVSLAPGRVREFDDVLNAVQAVLSVSVEPGAAVAIHTPTYPPFLDTIARMGYQLRPIPFERTSEGWHFDVAEAAATVASSAALILVNPHNPTGRVLRHHELEPMLTAATASHTLVIADEVHADLTHPGAQHTPASSLHPATVTVTSATKSHNLAGIRCAVAHIGSGAVWEGLATRPEHLFGAVSNLSIAATMAAWSEEGDGWLESLTSVLTRNRTLVAEGLDSRFDLVTPEATYLAWIDTARTGISRPAAETIRSGTGLILTPGEDFGAGGSGFVRLNFATSVSVLTDAIERMNAAL